MTEPDTVRKMSYAPFLAAVFLFWPICGILGAQGYAPLLLLAAIPALFYARPKMPPRTYVILGIAFILWVAATEAWSPASKGLISGSLSGGDLSIDTASLRIGLAALMALIVLPASMALAGTEKGNLAARIMLLGIAFQCLSLAVTAGATQQLIVAVYGDDPARWVNGAQNLSRNATAFTLVLPILAAYLWTRGTVFWRAISIFLVCITLISAIRLDSQATLLACITMIIGALIVSAFPKNGLRIMVGSLAAYIALAPLLFGLTLRFFKITGISLPGSFQSRAWAWERVIEITMEKPIFGHGINASKVWRETYADHPQWLAQLPANWAYYPVIPGHPHNMPLQIWAETGLVGALLASWALAMLALRLPAPSTLRSDVRYATGGIIGVMFPLISTSYNMWNEAFWASFVLAVCGIFLLAARKRESIT